jgi:hypothetical protein
MALDSMHGWRNGCTGSKPNRQFIPWPAVQEQFGPDFDRLRKFREKFMQALRQVCAVYPAAKIDVNRTVCSSTRRRLRS